MTASMKLLCTCIAQRWIFTILAGAGLCLQAIFSTMMPITIIEMVMQSNNTQEEGSGSCPSFTNLTIIRNTTFIASPLEDNPSIERYNWDEYTQGIILSSFSWVSAVAAFFYGSLAERFGGKYLLGLAIFVQAVFTFITPMVTHWGGSTALIVTRLIIGLASDGLFPVASKMIPQWSSPSERTTIGNAVYGGSVLGLFVGNIVPALIMKYSGLGWPAVFYFIGIIGIIWVPLWLFLVYENPDTHPFISDEEFNHLKSTSDVKKSEVKLPPAPYKHIFLCKEFWAYIICYIGCNIPYYIILMGLPRYLGNVVHFPIESNGYFSSMPYIFMWLFSTFSGWVNDRILEKQWMSLTNARKLLTTVSIVGPCTFLLLASYAECDKTTVVTMFMIGITLIGSVYPSLVMNPIDLSPNYAGTMSSIGSGTAALTGLLAPYAIGVLVPNSTISEWRLVFWLVFVSAGFTNVIYIWWFKAEVQPWNDPEFVRYKTRSSKENERVEL